MGMGAESQDGVGHGGVGGRGVRAGGDQVDAQGRAGAVAAHPQPDAVVRPHRLRGEAGEEVVRAAEGAQRRRGCRRHRRRPPIRGASGAVQAPGRGRRDGGGRVAPARELGGRGVTGAGAWAKAEIGVRSAAEESRARGRCALPRRRGRAKFKRGVLQKAWADSGEGSFRRITWYKDGGGPGKVPGPPPSGVDYSASFTSGSAEESTAVMYQPSSPWRRV